MRLVAALLFLASTVAAKPYFLTVAGLGGNSEYEGQFKKFAADFDQMLHANGPDAVIETLSGESATRDHLRAALGELAARMTKDDSFALFLIGHGTYDGNDYKFNLPGPDMTADDLAGLLNKLPASRQLIVNMTSASGAALKPFAQKNRIVITATKSGNEKNTTVFARYWIEGLRNNAADVDKSGSVSALEAYQYAEAKTAAYFDGQKLLATEHALIDDTGAGTGVHDPSPANGQGLAAATFSLVRPALENVSIADMNGPKRGLYERRQALENAIQQLKYQKANLPLGDYKQQLTALLLQLARTQVEIDR